MEFISSPSDINVVNIKCPNSEFARPGRSDAYFFAHWYLGVPRM